MSRELYVTPSNITGIIDRLEKKGLVQQVRKEGDRRVALITLTQAGEQLSSQLPDPIEIKLISALSDLEAGKVADLRESLKLMVRLVDAQEIEDDPLR